MSTSQVLRRLSGVYADSAYEGKFSPIPMARSLPEMVGLHAIVKRAAAKEKMVLDSSVRLVRHQYNIANLAFIPVAIPSVFGPHLEYRLWDATGVRATVADFNGYLSVEFDATPAGDRIAVSIYERWKHFLAAFR